MSLEDVRKNINTIDSELMDLFQKRLECSSRVANEKMKNGDTIFKPLREKEICEKFAQNLEISVSTIKNIMMNSRKYQYELFTKKNRVHEEFLQSITPEQKDIFDKGGELKLSLQADNTKTKGLSVNDIILAVADSNLEIKNVDVEDNRVTVLLQVGDDEASRNQAYIISYMLYMETVH